MDKKGFYLSLIVGLTTGVLITFFLSGKIIDIPHGTHEGGIIAATGTAIIILSMILIGFLSIKIIQKINK